MHVKKIWMSGFFCYDIASIELPPCGIVLVRGVNGSGKSALVEAVSVACWGKTLRGAEPWSGDKSHVGVETYAGLKAYRHRAKKSVNLTWNLRDREPTAYESTTKAQIALSAVLGSWDVWRRSSVFSSQDAANFSRSTDSERKHLLESVLGLECFDDAHERAKDLVRQAKNKLSPVQSQISVLDHKIGWEERNLQEAQKRLADGHVEELPLLESDEDILKRLERLQSMRDVARQELLVTRGKLDSARSSGVENDMLARQLRLMLAKLRDESRCPTCGQAVSDALRSDLQNQADEQARIATEAKQNIAEDSSDLQALVDELEQELSHLDKAVAEIRMERSKNEGIRTQHERLAKLYEQAEADIKKCRDAIDATTRERAEVVETLSKINTEYATAEACEHVLGLKGIRAHMLAQALDGIEAVANHWISMLFSKSVHVRLSQYSEKKTGGVSDSISLRVEGLGLGGYPSCSGGERRRIDVAMLLALAEIAGASAGQDPGTLFLDEVFDTLDTASAERVGEVLQAVSANRCVVVISHSDVLDECLTPAQRWDVDRGEIRVS